MLPYEILAYSEKGTNALGQPIKDWAVEATVSGWLDLLTGDEATSSQVLDNSTHIFITEDLSRWITSNHRIRNPRVDKTYEITYVDNPLENNHHLEIYCKRVA